MRKPKVARKHPFTAITQNIKGVPPMKQSRVEHDVRLTAQQGDVILWQEIHLDRYKKAIRDLGPQWDHFMPNGGGTPVSWRTDQWRMLEVWNIPLHDGRVRLSKDRTITGVILESLVNEQPLAVLNRHYISKAWSRGVVRRRAERQALWNEGNEADNAEVTRLVAEGYPVLLGGDMNSKPERLLPFGTHIMGRREVTYLTPEDSIDLLAAINGDETVLRVKGSDTLGERESDHRGRAATLVLRARRAIRDAATAAAASGAAGGCK